MKREGWNFIFVNDEQDLSSLPRSEASTYDTHESYVIKLNCKTSPGKGFTYNFSTVGQMEMTLEITYHFSNVRQMDMTLEITYQVSNLRHIIYLMFDKWR